MTTHTESVRAPGPRGARAIAPPRRRRWLLWLAVLVGLGAALALGASVAVVVARDAISEKLRAAGADRGLVVTHGAIEVPLVGPIAVRDLRVTRADGELLLAAARVETDVTFVEAALGRRRPGTVTLDGLDAHVAVVDGKLVGLDAPAPSSGGDGGAAEPIAVVVRDGRVSVDARQGERIAERVVLTDLGARLERDAERHLTADAQATLTAAGHSTPMAITLTAAGDLTVDFAEGAQIGVSTPDGPLWVGVRGAARARGDELVELTGLAVRRGDDQASVGKLTVEGGGSGLAPDPRAIRRVKLEDVAVERPAGRVVAGSATITLTAAPDGEPLAEPTEVAATDVGVESNDRRLRGTFADARVTLTGAWAALREGRPLDALGAVRFGRPRVSATVAQDAVAVAAPAGGEAAADASAGGDTAGIVALVEKLMGAASATGAAAAPDAGAEAEAGTSGGRARLARLLARLRAWQVQVADGVVDVKGDDGTQLLALDGLSLATRDADDGGLELEVRAAVLRNRAETGKVDVTATFDDAARLVKATGTVSGKDLAHQLSRFTPHVDVQPDSALDLTFAYTSPDPGDDKAPYRLVGSARLSQFTFEYWRVAKTPITDLDAQVDFELAVYRKDYRAVLALTDLRLGEVHLTGEIDVTKRPKEKLKLKTHLAMARQDCGAAARAIPKALIPRLSTLRLSGTMAFDARLTVDLADPYGLELKVTGDLERCEALSLGPGIDLEALKGPFVHVPVEPERGRLDNIRVGRGTREWVDGRDLPELVPTLAWITEDRRYYDHGGVRWDLVARAMKMDLEHERFIYGGSTITQQLVKNLYLDRGKSLARKLEEAFIAWQMERVLSKEEILTIYVNVIEYGPDIYGVKQAARFYFGKKVKELTPLEVAFIMGLKPYPGQGYKQWLTGTVNVWWEKRLGHVLGMLASRTTGFITKEEVDALAPFHPRFRLPDEPMDVGSRRVKAGEDGPANARDRAASERPAADDRDDAGLPAPDDDGDGGAAWEPWGPGHDP